MRWSRVPRYRIFYFRHSVLDHVEEVEVGDILGAVRKVSASAPDLKVEIWSEKGKVGIIGVSRDPAHHHVQFVPRGRPRLPR